MMPEVSEMHVEDWLSCQWITQMHYIEQLQELWKVDVQDTS